MEVIFNTSDPIIIIIYTLIIAGIIFLSRKAENPIIPVFLIVYTIILLIFHSTISPVNDIETHSKYISIAIDLIFLFLSFISYLWIDDINAKKKNLKNYDNSLSWFWDDL